MTDPAPIGRPSRYDPEEHPQAAEKLARNGKTSVEIAEALDVGITTFKRWMDERPLFRAAVLLGREQAIDRVERALFERAIGYTWNSEKLIVVSGGQGCGSKVERHDIHEHVPPDPVAIKYFLGNRRRKQWQDRQQITGADDGPIVIKVVRANDAPGTLSTPAVDGEP